MEEFSCLGLRFLGSCAYNPNDPANIYFGVGGAIAALGFLVAIQQLLRPVYQFRLRAYGIQLWHLTLFILISFIAVIVAALIPNLPINRDNFFAYPINWEIFGGVVVAAVYGIAALLVLRPANLSRWNSITFCRAAASLLAKADDDDRVSFADDIVHNIDKILKYANAWKNAERHAVKLEFERRKEAGVTGSIAGNVPISAFYRFAHRKELERATYADSLLRIMADKKFCSTLVRDAPWTTALMVNKIADNNTRVSGARIFVQSLAYEAITNDESMIAREIGYDGFGEAPILSESLFANPAILLAYDPLNTLTYRSHEVTLSGYVERLNHASLFMLKTALKHHGYWNANYMYDVVRAYEGLSLAIGWRTDANGSDIAKWHNGIRRLYKTLLDDLLVLDQDTRLLLFKKNNETTGTPVDLVSLVADIVFESLASVANDFQGYESKFWSHAARTFIDLFPSNAREPLGMNPLQQHLAIKFVELLAGNMDEIYPAISRVLLAVIGPYNHPPTIEKKTAYAILKDAVYKELQKLPTLHARSPDKVRIYLPSNVTYNSDTKSLTHIYRLGETKTTSLSGLEIPDVDFYDSGNWQQNEPE